MPSLLSSEIVGVKDMSAYTWISQRAHANICEITAGIDQVPKLTWVMQRRVPPPQVIRNNADEIWAPRYAWWKGYQLRRWWATYRFAWCWRYGAIRVPTAASRVHIRSPLGFGRQITDAATWYK